VAAALAAALALAGLAGAGDDPKAATTSLPPDLARVPGDAVALVSVRLGELWNSDAAAGLRGHLTKEAPAALDGWRQVVGLPPGDVERCTAVAPYLELGPGPYPLIFVATARPYERARVLANVGLDCREERRGGKVLYVSGAGHAVHFLGDRAYVAGPAGAVRDLLERPAAKKEGRLATALRLAAGRHALVAALDPEPIVREFGGGLPPQGESLRPLLKAELVTLTVDATAGLDGDLALTFPTEEDARKAQPVMRTGLTLARVGLAGWTKQFRQETEGAGAEAERFMDLVRRAAADLGDFKVRRRGTRVEVTAHVRVGPADAAVLLDEVAIRTRQAAERVESQNNLQHLAVAMHNYASAHGNRFPAQAVYGAGGKPLLSWRVLLLPYLGQDALYKEFRLDEPWDSEHNRKLLTRMPNGYAMPGAPPGATETYYQAFAGKSAFFDGRQGLTIPASFPDGTANTIMLAEASRPVPWTKPEDLPFDPDPTKPLPRLGGRFREGFNVVMVDGSTRFLRKTISDQALRAAITRDGGEVLGEDF
jgi:hypothetical protein